MDKKSKITTGLSFGIFMAIVFIVQGLLGEDNLSTQRIFRIVFSSAVGGAFAGVSFTWIMNLLLKSKFFEKGTEIQTNDGEKILFETGAGHFKGGISVGGKLYLTNQRLVFKSHKWNLRNDLTSINIPDINEVSKYKPLGIGNNGLAVTTRNSIEKFVLEQPEEWFKQLAEKNILQPLAV